MKTQGQTFTEDQVLNIVQNAVEIATAIGAAGWDAFPDRTEAVLTIAQAAIELDAVTDAGAPRENVEWGATHDYYEATEALAQMLVAFPGHPTPGAMQRLVMSAIDSSPFEEV